MKIKTINRRTFIKTMGGLVITAPFVAKMASLHAADLPDTITFKATVAKNTTKAGYKVLDTSSPGYVTVSREGAVINEYQFQTGGQVEFEIPTDGSSDLVWNILDKYGLITRTFGVGFNNGVLSLKNKLREDAAIPYYWSPEENCYQIEYYYNDVFICGPADPDSYMMSLAWAELNRASEKEKVETASPTLDPSDCSTCEESHCAPMSPSYPFCKDCPICQDRYSDEGEGENNYGVPDDSSTTDGESSGNVCDSDKDGLCDCTGSKISSAGGGESTLSPQAVGRLSPPAIAFSALMPVDADIYQTQDIGPQIETIDFGMMLKVIDPNGNEIGNKYLPFDAAVEIKSGMNFTIAWQDRAPFPAMRVIPDWEDDLVKNMDVGTYQFIFWTKTTDGKEGNKRIIWWRLSNSLT